MKTRQILIRTKRTARSTKANDLLRALLHHFRRCEIKQEGTLLLQDISHPDWMDFLLRQSWNASCTDSQDLTPLLLSSSEPVVVGWMTMPVVTGADFASQELLSHTPRNQLFEIREKISTRARVRHLSAMLRLGRWFFYRNLHGEDKSGRCRARRQDLTTKKLGLERRPTACRSQW